MKRFFKVFIKSKSQSNQKTKELMKNIDFSSKENHQAILFCEIKISHRKRSEMVKLIIMISIPHIPKKKYKRKILQLKISMKIKCIINLIN